MNEDAVPEHCWNAFAVDVLVTLAPRRTTLATRCFLSTTSVIPVRVGDRLDSSLRLFVTGRVRNGAHDITPGLKTVRMPT